MRGLIFFSLIFVSTYAFSARWIVEDAKLNVHQIHGVKLIKKFEIGQKKYSVIETPDLVATARVQSRLLNITQAQTVVEDIRIYLDQPIANDQEATAPGWHIQRMRYDSMNPNYQGQGVTVAVLDTGVDITHPHLASKIWTNPNEIPNNNIDDDSNGYIDDVHGWNFTNNTNAPTDNQGHGTHCAGIIAADPHPQGIARGVAPYVKIMPLKIIGGENSAFLSDAAEAVVYGANNGAKILSNSWGLYASWNGFNINQVTLQVFVDAMSHAYYMGTVYVASAGNNSLNLDVSNLQDLRIPLGVSGIYNMIGVASADHDGTNDTRSYFTNYGANYVHFAAPGSNIMSTVPGGWESMSGTSMATPLFAGVMARMLSKGYMWWDAVEVLRQTADNQAKHAWDGKIRYGYIDPATALQ